MHPDNAYIDICFHTVRADQVIGPDRGGQAIAVGINHRQQFLFAVERLDVAARAKNSSRTTAADSGRSVQIVG